jgi:hypothetical protein
LVRVLCMCVRVCACFDVRARVSTMRLFAYILNTLGLRVSIIASVFCLRLYSCGGVLVCLDALLGFLGLLGLYFTQIKLSADAEGSHAHTHTLTHSLAHAHTHTLTHSLAHAHTRSTRTSTCRFPPATATTMTTATTITTATQSSAARRCLVLIPFKRSGRQGCGCVRGSPD